MRAPDVNISGGTALIQDLLCYILNEAGMSTNHNHSAMSLSQVQQSRMTIIINEDDENHQTNFDSFYQDAMIVVESLDDETEMKFILDGAEAVTSFDASVNEFIESVKAVVVGGTVVTPTTARRLSELARLNSHRRPWLTKREIEILESVKKGESVKETAASLGISAKTVENLQSRLFRKLGVRNRAQAYAKAHSLGLLPRNI